MPYEGEIVVNNLPQGTTPNQADKIMLIDHETGDLKQFDVASLSTVVSDVSFTNAAKSALIALLEKVAYINGNGQQYLNELITNLAATVTSISAVFTQGAAVIYDTDSLDTLEQYLVVTADYSDGTSAVVTNYTLSGTLTVGTSTITVEYGQQTDTISVVVSNGFLYTPGNGMLSLQSYVDSVATDITDTFTESITGGFYRLTSPALSGSGTVAKRIVFTKRYNTKCVIKLDFKINDMPYLSNTNSSTPGVLFICGSNMDDDETTFNGLCIGVARKGSASGDIYLKIGTGSGAAWNASHFATGGVHSIIATMENGAQTIQLDGVTVLSSLSPYTATGYGTETYLRLMQGGSNPTSVDIQRLEMYFE